VASWVRNPLLVVGTCFQRGALCSSRVHAHVEVGKRLYALTVLMELTTPINRRNVAGVPGIWRALTSLLAAETKLYLPPTLQTSDSRALFGDMWRLRKQWAVQEEQIPQVG
jgi:hypothetical protein